MSHFTYAYVTYYICMRHVVLQDRLTLHAYNLVYIYNSHTYIHVYIKCMYVACCINDKPLAAV